VHVVYTHDYVNAHTHTYIFTMMYELLCCGILHSSVLPRKEARETLHYAC